MRHNAWDTAPMRCDDDSLNPYLDKNSAEKPGWLISCPYKNSGARSGWFHIIKHEFGGGLTLSFTSDFHCKDNDDFTGPEGAREIELDGQGRVTHAGELDALIHPDEIEAVQRTLYDDPQFLPLWMAILGVPADLAPEESSPRHRRETGAIFPYDIGDAHLWMLVTDFGDNMVEIGFYADPDCNRNADVGGVHQIGMTDGAVDYLSDCCRHPIDDDETFARMQTLVTTGPVKEALAKSSAAPKPE